jgi:hypothetical protein
MGVGEGIRTEERRQGPEVGHLMLHAIVFADLASGLQLTAVALAVIDTQSIDLAPLSQEMTKENGGVDATRVNKDRAFHPAAGVSEKTCEGESLKPRPSGGP